MLAHPYAEHKINSFPVYVQPKLDGIRALYQGGNFHSRDCKLFSRDLLRHIEHPDIVQNVVFDGEFYAHGASLQAINSAVAVNRKLPTEFTERIKFHVFDCYVTTNPDLPFSQRLDYLQTIHSHLHSWKGWNVVPTEKFDTIQLINNFHRNCLEQSYEGSIIRLDSSYVQTRSWSLLKRKDFIDDEFDVIGYTEGTGKHLGRMGALACRTKHGEVFYVGGGFSDFERDLWYGTNAALPKRIKVKFQKLTDGGIPRHPNFMCTID